MCVQEVSVCVEEMGGVVSGHSFEDGHSVQNAQSALARITTCIKRAFTRFSMGILDLTFNDIKRSNPGHTTFELLEL